MFVGHGLVKLIFQVGHHAGAVAGFIPIKADHATQVNLDDLVVGIGVAHYKPFLEAGAVVRAVVGGKPIVESELCQ